MYKLKITNSAKNDLQEALLYIKNQLDAPKAAQDLYSEFIKRTKILKTFPKIASVVKDKILAELKIRTLLIKNYFVVYTIDEQNKNVSIIRFLYAKSNYTEILKSDVTKK